MTQSSIRTKITGRGVSVRGADIDTDRIIPARFLRTVTFDGLGDHAFEDDRAGGQHPFDQAQYQGAKILLVNENFGCGSSRENAVSVLRANKVRSVIAPSFGDIHYNNCIKNGVLPIRLSSEVCETLRRQLHESPGAEIAIDLDAQSLTGPDQTSYEFEIEPFDKHRLLNGLDEIVLTMEFESDIADFKTRYEAKHAWAG